MSPNNVREALLALKAAMAARDRRAINTVAATLLESDAKLGNQWEALATLMLHNGELTMACAAMDRLVAEVPSDTMAKFKQAGVFARSGREAEAAAIMRTLPETIPDRCGNAYIQGTIALNLGETDAARTHLLRAVGANAASGQSWLVLAMTGNMAASPDIADAIIAVKPKMAAASVEERATYAYALGKTYDDLGDFANAALAFRDGANLVRPTRAYSQAADAAEAKSAISGFSHKRMSEIGKSVSVETARPIIVTGTPRSGTTLVEQILASHSGVSHGMELGSFGLVIQDVGGNSASVLDAFFEKRGTADQLASLYLHLIGERFGPSGRIIDKSLDASRYLGILASIMPDAPLIWMRRDPIDRAWSCYRTYFLRGVAWSWSFEDIATHFRLEDQLLTQWQDILGERLLVVDYEDLVSAPEQHIPAIVTHCGLTFEPAMLEPHKTKRIVSTASVVQVRQPINRDAIGKAKAYEALMAPFSSIYGKGQPA